MIISSQEGIIRNHKVFFDVVAIVLFFLLLFLFFPIEAAFGV